MTEMSLNELTQLVKELQEKVQVAEDIEQIKKLHNRYMNAHTTGDTDVEMECFVDDATFECGTSHPPMVGKKEIAKFVKHEDMPPVQAAGPMSAPEIPNVGHFIVHPIINVDGDKATGSWLQYCLHSDSITMQLLFFVQGFYTVEYVKKNGEWKYKYLKWVPRSEPRGFG